MRFRCVCILSLLFLGLSCTTWAQATQPDPWEQTRFRTGPLAWTPTIQLKSFGWDTNVFNQAQNPKKDFTATVSPQVDWWLRAGRARLHGTNVVDGVYFVRYKDERSINQSHQMTFEYPLNRVRPFAGGSYLNTRDRPGFEIDARAAHTETAAKAGAAIRLSGKTSIEFAGRYTTYVFAGDAEFQGTSLSEILNRWAAYGTATFRYALTPLTSLTLLGETGREQFDEAPLRDNRSVRVMPGVEFDPFALLKGSARVGYRRLNMSSPSIPDYSGVVAAVNLAYVFRGRTRLSAGVDRDIQFSFEVQQPYYVLTGVSGSVRQSLARGIDVEIRGANQRLAYQSASGAAVAADRTDRVEIVGGGIGYTLSRGSRVGLNADHVRRRSRLYNRAFEGLRAGLSVTYGF